MRTFALAVFALLLPVHALAATPINELRPMDATGSIDIENIRGKIQVRGWEREEVKITGTLGQGVEALIVEGDRQQLEVRVKYPRSSGWGRNRAEASTLELMVPLRSTLQIESVSASVDVTGIASQRLGIETVSGPVAVVGAPGRIDVDSVSGNVRLTVNSSDVSAESVSGRIILRGRMDGAIKAEAVSGNIDIGVNGEAVRKISANTVSGSISVDAALAEGGEIGLESVSGRLALALPSNLSARVRGESMSGTLRAPGATIDKPRYGPGSSFDTRYGSGNGDIRLETLSGDAGLRLK